MSKRPFNLGGETFEVPAQALGWRARKLRARSSPQLVVDSERGPLVLPISAGIDELRAAIGTRGRYRIEFVDRDDR